MAASLRRFVESEFARVRRLRAGGGVDTASPQADSKEQGRDHEQPAFLVFEDILKCDGARLTRRSFAAAHTASARADSRRRPASQ
jgi:hypothetical protein